MEIDDEMWPELVEMLTQSSEEKVIAILVTSAKQLRFGDQRRRDMHRYIVEQALAELAERGKGYWDQNTYFQCYK